jgi:DNA-binding NtrC family response regulator
VWDCIYLTSSLALADATVRLLGRANIRTRPVASLDDARAMIGLGSNLALITESKFLDGNWWDALEMVKESAPRVPVIVLLREFDGALWVQALKSGAYDVLADPRDSERLSRTVIGALQRRAVPGLDSQSIHARSWHRRLARRLRVFL